jgi:ribose transport system substrate-binding protein
MGGKGNVIALEGVKGTLTNIDRMRGVRDVMKDYPNIKLLAAQPGNYQRLQALQVMENLMQSYPQIDGVFAANDAMAAGAIEAMEGANRKALVVGINGTKEAVDAVNAGKMLATGDYNGFLQGCLGTMAALRSLRGLPVPKEIVLPAAVIDKSNTASQAVPVEQRSCPRWEDAVKS